MKLLRFLGALLAIAVVSVVWLAAVPSVVNAQTSCSDRVPWVGFIGDGALMESAAAGVLAPVAPALDLAAPTVATGGVGTSVAIGATWAIAGVSAFFAASMATCVVLDLSIGGVSIGGLIDFANGGTAAKTQNVAGFYSGSVTFGPEFTCGTLSGWAYSRYAANGKCRQVITPSSVVSSHWYISGSTARTWGGVTIPAVTVPDRYQLPVGSIGDSQNFVSTWQDSFIGSDGQTGSPAWHSAPNTWYNCYFTGTNNGGGNCPAVQPSGSGPNVWEFLCQRNVGDQCGVPPGLVATLATPLQGSGGSIAAVAPVRPELTNKGWRRRIVTDVACRAATGTALSWVRVESATYWDQTPNVRIPVPKCAAGTLLTKYRVAEVPTNVACAVASGAGCAAKWRLETYTAPNLWFDSATAPSWTFCLTAGNDCGAPATVSGVCKWGTYTIPDADACVGGLHTDPGVVVRTVPVIAEPLAPTIGQVLDTAVPVLAVPVVVPPPGGGGNVTVNIPIDDGGGECSGRAGCIAVNAPIGNGDEAVCWPDSWGWFNPAEWVLRPIRCGMRWAFVPTGTQVQNSWAALTAEANSAVPIAWVVNGADLMHDVVDGLDAGIIANESQCVTWMPTGLEGASGNAGRVCLQAALAGTAWGPWRGRVGVAVFIMWAFLLVGTALSIIGGTREAKTESFYVNHDY